MANVEVLSTTSGITSTTTYYYAGSQRVAEAVNGAFSYQGNDPLGSADVALDSSGNTQAAELYAPYGGTRYSSGTMPGSYWFTGQRADSTTGLDYYNTRYYDAAAGQFTSADDILAGDGYDVWGLSRYAYVEGNPETHADPSGRCPWCLAGALIGAAVGLTVAAVPIVQAIAAGKPPTTQMFVNLGVDTALGAGAGLAVALNPAGAGIGVLVAAAGMGLGALTGGKVDAQSAFQQLAVGAITGAIGGGAGGEVANMAAKMTGSLTGNLMGIGIQAGVQATVAGAGDALYQDAGMLTGEQKSYNWGETFVAAGSAGVFSVFGAWARQAAFQKAADGDFIPHQAPTPLKMALQAQYLKSGKAFIDAMDAGFQAIGNFSVNGFIYSPYFSQDEGQGSTRRHGEVI